MQLRAMPTPIDAPTAVWALTANASEAATTVASMLEVVLASTSTLPALWTVLLSIYPSAFERTMLVASAPAPESGTGVRDENEAPTETAVDWAVIDACCRHRFLSV